MSDQPKKLGLGVVAIPVTLFLYGLVFLVLRGCA